MAAPITAYFKDSDWLLKNFDQLENGLKSYQGNQGNHVREPEKLGQKTGVKSDLAYCLGSLIEKTNSGSFCSKERKKARSHLRVLA